MNIRYKNSMRSVVLLIAISLFIALFPINAEAYPLLSFYGDENFETMISDAEVTQGETYVIRMKWFPEYKNEGYDLVVEDSNGSIIASSSDTFYNTTIMRTFSLSWDTKNVPPGKYTVNVTKKFYSLYRWNEAPYVSTMYIYVKSPCTTKGHSYGTWETTKAATVFAQGEKTHKCKVCGDSETITIDKLKPTIKLSKTKATLRKGKSLTIKVSKLAKGDKVKSWKSSNKKIATVKKGKIKALKKGKAKITVTLKSGKKATVKVTVK